MKLLIRAKNNKLLYHTATFLPSKPAKANHPGWYKSKNISIGMTALLHLSGTASLVIFLTSRRITLPFFYLPIQPFRQFGAVYAW